MARFDRFYNVSQIYQDGVGTEHVNVCLSAYIDIYIYIYVYVYMACVRYIHIHIHICVGHVGFLPSWLFNCCLNSSC